MNIRKPFVRVTIAKIAWPCWGYDVELFTDETNETYYAVGGAWTRRGARKKANECAAQLLAGTYAPAVEHYKLDRIDVGLQKITT